MSTVWKYCENPLWKINSTIVITFLLSTIVMGNEGNNHQSSVIIVGGGAAGIAAATRLLENNYTKILLLEAENRIGGRIHSVYFGEAYIDLGAEWCHGQDKNIVYQLAKDLDILKHTETNMVFYHSSREQIDPDFASELQEIMHTIYEADGQRHKIEGRTVGDYCVERYNESIYEKYGNDSGKLVIAKEALDTFQHHVLGSEGAFNWYDPSAENDYRSCEGDLYLNWNGFGYKSILDILMKKFPDPSKQLPIDQTVLLNKEVTRIVWNDSDVITVECSDLSRYESQHVIFTPSIGVLKATHQHIFHPSLPRNKQEAIKVIGFGAVMKIAIHFNEKWWHHRNGENFTGFTFIWDGDDRALLKEFPEGPRKKGKSWLTYLYSLMPVENNPNVLIAWLTGDLIPEIDKTNDTIIIKGLNFVLNKFLGHHFNISKPDLMQRSFWHSNPHFRGTYSYQTVKARGKGSSAEVELAKPLENERGKAVVQFAGEATHPHFYSTVHGAIETGYREADRILNVYNKR